MVRFFQDDREQEENSLQTELDYKLDILASADLKEYRIFLIRGGNFLGEEIKIDMDNHILLELSTQSIIENKFSNSKYLKYLAKFIGDSHSIEQKLRFIYANIRFATGQEGEYSLCLTENKRSSYCTCQGMESYLTFSVKSSGMFSIAFVILVFALALFLSALTSALTLGIMTLDTHELQVLIK